jgi:hypothetical protein
LFSALLSVQCNIAHHITVQCECTVRLESIGDRRSEGEEQSCAVEVRNRQGEEREMLWVMIGDTRRRLEQSADTETLPIILFSSSVRVREV